MGDSQVDPFKRERQANDILVGVVKLMYNMVHLMSRMSS